MSTRDMLQNKVEDLFGDIFWPKSLSEKSRTDYGVVSW